MLIIVLLTIAVLLICLYVEIDPQEERHTDSITLEKYLEYKRPGLPKKLKERFK